MIRFQGQRRRDVHYGLKQTHSWTTQNVRDDCYEIAEHVVTTTLESSGYISHVPFRNVNFIQHYQLADTANANNGGPQNEERFVNLYCRSVDLVRKHSENTTESETGIHQRLKVRGVKQLPFFSYFALGLFLKLQ